MRFLAWLDAFLFRLLVATGGQVVWRPRESPPATLPLEVAPMDAAVLQRSRARVRRVAEAEGWPDTTVPRLVDDIRRLPVPGSVYHGLRLARSLSVDEVSMLAEIESLGRLNDPR